MAEPYYETSEVTGKTYDIFNIVRILNLHQAIAYMANGVNPVDIEIGRDKRSQNRCLVFIFDRDESAEVYDKWCKYELM